MASQIYWITRLDQLRATTNPVSHDILDRLTALGPLSVRDLADALRRKPTAIYRYLKVLEDVGLVKRDTSFKKERGRPATIYRPIAPIIRGARAPRLPRNRKQMAKMAAAMAKQAGRDYGRAFASKDWTIEGPGRNHWFFRLVTAPSPQKLARINRLLDEILELMWTPDPKPGPLIRVAWFMSPASDTRTRKGKSAT